MFVLKKVTTVWWPVKVKVPDEKVIGRFQTHEFEAEFKIMDADESKTFQDARSEILSADETPETIMQRLNAFELETWSASIIDWRGVFDEDKNEIPYSEEMLAAAVKQPLTRAAFQRAQEEILAGEPRRKN